MTIVLYDDTTTLQLDALNDYMLLRYAKQAPQPAMSGQPTIGSDHAFSPHELPNVTESLELLIRGTTTAEIRTRARAIQTILRTAHERQKFGAGSRVYLQDSGVEASGVARSEILSGRLLFNNEHDQLSRLNAEAVLSITRRPFWEGARVQIATLTSSEDSTPAVVVDLYNNDDASASATNWINIPASDTPNQGVAGVLATPAEIKLTNDHGSDLDWREFYISNTVFSDPANFDPFLLGSEATGGASYALTTSEAVGWRWLPAVLTDSRLEDLAGRHYRILVTFGTGASTTGVYLRAQVESYISGSPVTLYQGRLIPYNGEGLIDLGAVPIPPGGYDTAGSDISLAITAFRPAGTATMHVDFVQMTPAGDGLFQQVSQVDFAASTGSAIVTDGIEGLSYFDNGDGKHISITRTRGQPILLFPGRTNRLRVLFSEETGFTAGRHIEGRVWYRPRYLDL